MAAQLSSVGRLHADLRRDVCSVLCAEVELATLCYCALHPHEQTVAVNSATASVANLLRIGHFQVALQMMARPSAPFAASQVAQRSVLGLRRATLSCLTRRFSPKTVLLAATSLAFPPATIGRGEADSAANGEANGQANGQANGEAAGAAAMSGAGMGVSEWSALTAEERQLLRQSDFALVQSWAQVQMLSRHGAGRGVMEPNLLDAATQLTIERVADASPPVAMHSSTCRPVIRCLDAALASHPLSSRRTGTPPSDSASAADSSAGQEC
uniref:Uncharacterized protein n=1 Tax=Haptolina ericina TaxID=156174 RepID=A0A7S3AHU2_9EUKA